MVPSMFNLDHRLAELRPSADELRIAREVRDAADIGSGPAVTRRIAGDRRPAGVRVRDRSSRLATS
jgi:hypothetical protein